MSNENRDYPAWLDEELFGAIKDADSPAQSESSPDWTLDAPQETSAAPEESAPDWTLDAPQEASAAPEEDEPNWTLDAPQKENAPAESEAERIPQAPQDMSWELSSDAKEDLSWDKAAPAPEDGSAEAAAAAAAPPAAPKKKKQAPADKDGGDKPKAKKGEKGSAAASGKKKKPAAAPQKSQSAAAPKKSGAKKSAGKPAKSGRAARGVLIGLLGVLSLVLIACVAVVIFATIVTNSDTNMPNVCLGELNVGGMTHEETLQALEDAGWEAARGGSLKVSLPVDVSFELDYLRAGACQSAEEAAETAFRYGHSEDRFDNLMVYVRSLITPVDLSRDEFVIDRAYVYEAVDAAVKEFEQRTDGKEYTINEEASTIEFVKGVGQLSLDRDAICDRACEALLAGEHEIEWTEITGELRMPDFNALAEELAREPVNAYYDPALDEFFPEVKGASLDAEKAKELWEKADLLETISMPIVLIDADISEENLREVIFHDKLGDCMTYLWGSTANRISNVRLACSRFDGMVLQPGESFSYNDVVGERTEESGFKVAPVYSGTAHLDGIGGGICQVSSTLYNAVQYANLEVNERVCHTMLVGYLAPGLDATVDWPDTNFVFTNNREYPIKLKAWVDDNGRSVTIEIWGTNVDGSWVDIIHGSYSAYDETYREKYGLNVEVGTGAWNYRRVNYPDGTHVDGPKVYSYYHTPEEDIRWPAIPGEDDDYDEVDYGGGGSGGNDGGGSGGDVGGGDSGGGDVGGGESGGGDVGGGESGGGDVGGGESGGGDVGGGESGGGDVGGGESGGGDVGGGESGGEEPGGEG